MGPTPTGRLGVAFALALGLVSAALGERACLGAAAEPTTPTQAVPPPEPGAVDTASARAEVAARLAGLPQDPSRDDAAARDLRQTLGDRRRRLDEYDDAVRRRRSAENPEPSPDAQAAAWKADLARVRALADQAAKDPDALLPKTFLNLPEAVPEPLRVELKDAIEAAGEGLREWTRRADEGRKPAAPLAAVRDARDKAFQRVAGLKARADGRPTPAAGATTTGAPGLEIERLENERWEGRVEAERLRGLEALLALEARRADLAGLNTQVCDAHVDLDRRTLGRMKLRFTSLARRQEQDLHTRAERQQSRAERIDDPLERYRAKRSAELLEQEALVLKTENLLATNPSPSPDEQSAKADRDATDFSNVKHLLDDGRVSHLDALRLTNDFRRISVERAKIVRNDLAPAAARLRNYENYLSAVEMELLYDARDDRDELDNLRERLPKPRQAQAQALFDDFERRHVALLNRRRQRLEKLADRAEQTHSAVLRRLKILDDHFGFIRTHIFWVRNEEPIGPGTLSQAGRECRQLARAGLRIAAELGDPSARNRLTPEFGVAALALVVLPWPIHRLRRGRRAPRDVRRSPGDAAGLAPTAHDGLD